MRRLILIILVVALAACATPTPIPTPIAPVATSTSLPPTITAQTPLDYRAAMRPEFAAEIDRFARAPQYQIDLEIAPDLKSYSATQVVTYTNVETATLNEVYFRLFPNSPAYGGQLKIESLRANGVDVTPVYELDNTALRIDLAQPLKPDEAIEFELAYSVQVPTEDVVQGYNQFGLHDGILTLPNFYPQIPVYDDEGWNITPGPGYGDAVFSDTALYQVNITAPADQVVATSGTCEATLAGRGAECDTDGALRQRPYARFHDCHEFRLSGQFRDDRRCQDQFVLSRGIRRRRETRPAGGGWMRCARITSASANIRSLNSI